MNFFILNLKFCGSCDKIVTKPWSLLYLIATLIFQSTRCVNQIEEVCKDIEKTINQTIQNTLNQLEKDCEQISKLVDDAIKADDNARSYNFRAKVWVYLCIFHCYAKCIVLDNKVYRKALSVIFIKSNEVDFILYQAVH